MSSPAQRHAEETQVPPAEHDQLVLTVETIVETSIYATDLNAMEAFYSRVLSFEIIDKEAGRHVFFRVGLSSVLLIFNADSTSHGHHLPPHGATGPSHVAFGIKESLLTSWRARLVHHGIAIEKEQSWPRGGRSIYFRDPAGNSIELITPHVWGTPSGW